MILTRKLPIRLYYRWQHQGPVTQASKPMLYDKSTLRNRRRRISAFVREHGGKVLRVHSKGQNHHLVVRGPTGLFEALKASDVASFVHLTA